jgi:hypothetical protein
MDKRIGSTQDGSEPEVCAVSGELVQGRHNVQYMLPGGYFYRVLNKRQEQWTQKLHDELASLVSKPAAVKKLEGDK